ncbi:unnamed protein product [Rotaria sordida]|uniref:Tetratricopeptide repeat protein n=1 Tax=Rotaria sordida TaxID=392033 RepID=A0A819QTJ8_9BILA|nr:unnamed protein product [Rotaria sordida]CAF4036858.1 unnamed protein product [Rotaria sordida]CAF4152530.1 unnamed protein product [Rotaria sordida]
MANLRSVQNQYAEALPLYEQVYEQFQQFYETDEHADIAHVLNNMDEAHRLLGDLNTAIDYARRGLAIRRNKLQSKHEDLQETEKLVIQLQQEILTVSQQ